MTQVTHGQQLFSSDSLGFHVIATARRPDSISHLAKEGMTTITLDVTNQESIVACETEVRKVTNGHLDVLVNNAYVALFCVSSLPPIYTAH